MINIYCDESCHLPNDNSPIMVIGGISCPVNKINYIHERIFKIKQAHNIPKFAEIKWQKVSKSKLSMYKALVDVFFDNTFLEFRAVVATEKKQLSLEKYGLTYDDWYQRIYYLVLREMIDVQTDNAIYIDIKDTKGSEKIDKLKAVLNNTFFSFYDDVVTRVQLVKSDQIQLLQLSDLIIGAIGYANRGLTTSEAKLELIQYIEQKSSRLLTRSTPKNETKFNLFQWAPRELRK